MNAEILAEWHRMRGLRVLHTESSYWYDCETRAYQAFPFHWIIQPSHDEINGILRRQRATGLRYSAPLDAKDGAVGYHVVYEQPHYELADLSHQSRSNVRKGLRYGTVEQISLERLATEGWKLRYDTLARQSRLHAESQSWWEGLCRAAADLPGFEAWATVHEGEMLASLLAFTCDDCVCLLYLQSGTDHLNDRPNNALFYEVTRTAIARPGISQVFAGLHSLDAPPSVDEFKFRMNYEPRLVRERVVLHPLLTPLLGGVAANLVGRLNARRPGMPRLRKFEGMVRTAVQGKLPIEQQAMPPVVATALAEQGALSATEERP